MVLEEGTSSFFCSICKRNRPAEDFEYNKQDKRKLTCHRHSRKKPLEINRWEEFIQAIRRWNRPVGWPWISCFRRYWQPTLGFILSGAVGNNGCFLHVQSWQPSCQIWRLTKATQLIVRGQPRLGIISHRHFECVVGRPHGDNLEGGRFPIQTQGNNCTESHVYLSLLSRSRPRCKLSINRWPPMASWWQAHHAFWLSKQARYAPLLSYPNINSHYPSQVACSLWRCACPTDGSGINRRDGLD